MTREEFEAKRKKILDNIHATIDSCQKNKLAQVEIFAGYANGASVTVEKNDIQTYETYEETVYGIRVIENGCEGFVTTNNTKDLFSSVLEAASLAKSQNTPDDALELPPAPSSLTLPIDHLEESLFNYDPDKVLETAKEILSIREKEYPKVSLDSADASLSYSLKAIGTTKGIFRSEAGSSLSSSYMGMAIDGDDIGSFDAESAFGRSQKEYNEHFQEKYYEFLKSCMNGLGAKTIPGFKGYLYLPPSAIFSFLLGGFIGSLSATGIRMKRSKMEGKIGEAVLNPQISIVSDPTNPDIATCTSFDREGQNTQKLPIVENGVLKNYFYNHYEAKKAALPSSNGFATGGSGSTPGCGAKALEILPGKDSMNSMKNPDGKAIWVNRFSGSSSGSSGDFSGVIKGGFLLEKGEKIPVKEIQIAGNIFTILKDQIAAVSKERELLGKSTWAPALLLDGISITGS
jgi:PmbA protein